jgi:hypothetical protein
VVTEDEWGSRVGHYRVTVLVEPVESWVASTWRAVADLFGSPVAPAEIRVRIKDKRGDYHEGVVEYAAVQAWHVDPRSSDYRPVPLEHEVVAVRLSGRPAPLSMPPSGPVELLAAGPVGPALETLLAGGLHFEAIEEA